MALKHREEEKFLREHFMRQLLCLLQKMEVKIHLEIATRSLSVTGAAGDLLVQAVQEKVETSCAAQSVETHALTWRPLFLQLAL